MRSMKIVLVVLLLTFANFAFAQRGSVQQQPTGAPSQGQQPAGEGDAAMGTMSVDDELKSLAAQLNLTADQKTKAFSILKEREEGVIQVRTNFPVAQPGSSPSKEGIAAMDKVMAGTRSKMLTILNDEQKKKYEAINSMPEQGGPQM